MEINRRLMELVSIPVSRPEDLYQCGTWSTVYPPQGYIDYTPKEKICCGKNIDCTNTKGQPVQSKDNSKTSTKGE